MALPSARWIGSASNGWYGLTSIVLLAACSCRAVPDGSTLPASSEVSEPRTPGPVIATPTPAPEPSAPKSATPASVGEQLPDPKPDPAPAPVAEPQASEDDQMLEFLGDALRETPFSAIVQKLHVDVVPLGSDEVKFVYQVRVIENIRGPKLQKLTYNLIAEKGEDPGTLTTEPIILTLCKNQEGFYWPGTGAQFPRTKETTAVVEKVRHELKADQKVFAQCPYP
jgi:hypothetical protein